MIKEIVDIGRVSSDLATVFTPKGLPKDFVKVKIEYNGKDFNLLQNKTPLESIVYQSDYISYGVHRGKKGSTLYFFPTSFIVSQKEVKSDKKKLVKKLDTGIKEILKVYKKDDENINFIKKLSSFLIEHIDKVLEYCDDGFKKIESEKYDRKYENIAVILEIKENDEYYYISQKKELVDIFKEVEFLNIAKPLESGSGKEKTQIESRCNILGIEDKLYYPSGGFYYPFSTDKSNVKYNLNDEKNLFTLSKQAHLYFMSGKTFLESFHEFYFMGLRAYITITALDDDILKKFNKFIIDANNDLKSLLHLIAKVENPQDRRKALLNFYFFEPASTGGGKEILEFIKDVIPTTLISNVKTFDSIKNYFERKTSFNREFNNFFWQRQIHNIFYKENHKKFRTALFKKIALNDNIELLNLYYYVNTKMEYGINKDESDKYRYFSNDAIRNYIFLNWIDKINQGDKNMIGYEEEKDLIIGEEYEERLSSFLNNANLVKQSPSIKIGVCMGLMIEIISWSITNYDKKILSFVSKKIERNNLNSLQLFANEIFAKSQLHGFDKFQSENIRLTTMEMIKLDDNSFNKDEFIFGLFLGNELYSSIKKEKNNKEDKTNIQGEENE